MDKKDNMQETKRIDKDGVVYIRSAPDNPTYVNTAKRPSTGTKSTAGASRRDAWASADELETVRKRTKAKKHKSYFAPFLALTVFVGIIIAVISFATVFNAALKNGSNSPVNNPSSLPSFTPNVTATPETPVDEAIGLVVSTNPSAKAVRIYNITEDKEYVLTADGTTLLKDKYGKAVAFSEFKPGDIVEAGYNKKDSTLQTLKMSAQGFILREAQNVKVNISDLTVTVGNETYSFDTNLISTYNGGAYSVGDIDTIDVITLKGYKNKVYYVELVRGHGYIKLSGGEKILNGSLELGSAMSMSLDEKNPLKVPEGSHAVVVTGTNIEPYLSQVQVAKDQTAEVSLKDVSYNAGEVTININEASARLFLNGNEKIAGEKMTLKFGDYSVKVTKEGFSDYETTFNLSEPEYSLDVSLEKIMQVASVTIKTSPPGADVYINNTYVGITPLTTSVEYGSKTITIKMSGYNTIEIPINISNPEVVFDPPIELIRATY